jgi:hypothetical protein
MVALTEETKQEIVRLLGYPDYLTVSTDVADKLGRQDYTEANVNRIDQIINLITGQPNPDDVCGCEGGIDYQLDRGGLDSNVAQFDKLTFDHTGAIKRLRYSGMRLTAELSNMVRVEIAYNRYGAKAQDRPIAYVSFPS